MLSLPLSLIALSSFALATPLNVDKLFRRADTLPDVGSDEWRASYPAAGSTPSSVPQAWTDALNNAVKAGQIPSNVPVATLTDGWPTYPTTSEDPLGKIICSNPWGCVMPEDGFDAPDGMIGISQDDGPLQPGVRLYKFFEQENINATHFYIGGNVLSNPDIFLQAKALPRQHFAVHTWSHPYMTGLSNEDVVAEIGWTMQILADSNGGRIPSFWRPPYGDVDNRVRAIATHVFGLKTIIWNNDSEDWRIGAGETEDQVKSDVTGWLNGKQSPGLILLQHELNDGAVDAFISMWPLYQKWQTRTIPDLWNDAWYKNAQDDTSAVVEGLNITSPYTNGSLPSTGASSSPSTSPSSAAISGTSSPISSSISQAIPSASASQAASKASSQSANPSSALASNSALKAAAASASSTTSGADINSAHSIFLTFVGSFGLLAFFL